VNKVFALLIMLSLVLPTQISAGDQGASEGVAFRVTVDNTNMSVGSTPLAAAPEAGAQEAADAAAVLGASKGISAGAVTAAVLGAAAVAGVVAAAGGGGGGGHGH
jgi:hypothetical protein